MLAARGNPVLTWIGAAVLFAVFGIVLIGTNL